MNPLMYNPRIYSQLVMMFVTSKFATRNNYISVRLMRRQPKEIVMQFFKGNPNVTMHTRCIECDEGHYEVY